ncbi:MAG: potassium transporter TrkH [Rhodobacteraceae bacterium PARR1]|nr:MAG: potassium transporter TrkH [Rhodobacteraceae bacterium PARR1]
MRDWLRDLPLLLQMAAITALSMLLPAAHATVTGDHHVARAFFYSAVILLVLLGFVALAVTGHRPRDLTRAHLTALLWAYLLLPVLMALPMTQALPGADWVDLWFEMISAFTTTGATLLDAAAVPDTLHLWRAQAGWMGGFVILVAAAAILAPVNLGGAEVITGRVPGQRDDGPYWFTGTVDPAARVRRHAGQVLPVYAGVTLALWLGLILAGGKGLPAFVLALSSVSTSGITMGQPVPGRWAEVLILLVLLMALSRRFWPGAAMRREVGPIRQDPELRLALVITGVVTAILFLRHAVAATDGQGLGPALAALWGAVFTTISFLTTTGFVSADWETARFWSGLDTPGVVLAGLAILGGGVATTAGGVKLLRVHALFRHSGREMEKLIHPNSVGARGFQRDGAYAAWIFFMLTALSIAAGTAVLTLLGQGFEPALVLTLSALTTTGHLAQLSAESPIALALLSPWVKLAMGGLMIVGRLETLALLVFLVPATLRR